MTKKFVVFNVIVVSIFALYLISLLFIDYSKPVKIAILATYLVIAAVRAMLFIKNFKGKQAPKRQRALVSEGSSQNNNPVGASVSAGPYGTTVLITGIVVVDDLFGIVADDGLLISATACFMPTTNMYHYCEVCNERWEQCKAEMNLNIFYSISGIILATLLIAYQKIHLRILSIQP